MVREGERATELPDKWLPGAAAVDGPGVPVLPLLRGLVRHRADREHLRRRIVQVLKYYWLRLLTAMTICAVLTTIAYLLGLLS